MRTRNLIRHLLQALTPTNARRGWKQHLAKSERGQSLVEMTFGFTVLILIVSGLVDLGRAYFMFVALEDGAGEAALYAAINPSCLTDNADPSDGICDAPNNADDRARNSSGGLVDWTTATIDVRCAASCDLGDRVVVDISYPIELLSPVMPAIAGGNSLTLTATATQNVIGELD